MGSESQFSSSWWKRYLDHFDRLKVFAREGKLCTGVSLDNLEVSSAEGVEFFFGPNLSSPFAQLRERASAASKVRGLLKDVDAVIARLPSELGLLAISEAQKMDKPWAIELAGCPWDGLWNYGSLQGKLYAPVMAFRIRRVVSAAPFALYVTQRFLQERYPNSKGVTVACSNVEIPSISSNTLDSRMNRIQSRKRSLVLGLIGTLKTRYKGIQTVMEALGRVRHRLPAVQFRILGAGDESSWRAEAVRFGVDDIAVFQGVLPAGDPVLNWLDNVDIYLQPSFKEGLPRALIEAMSRGCPAIASRCAGIPELLGDECLITPGDSEHLGELLVQRAEDIEWQKRQAESNWREAEKYTLDKLAVRRGEFYRQFAAYSQGQLK